MENGTSIENIIIAEPDVKPNMSIAELAELDAWHYGASY